MTKSRDEDVPRKKKPGKGGKSRQTGKSRVVKLIYITGRRQGEYFPNAAGHPLERSVVGRPLAGLPVGGCVDFVVSLDSKLEKRSHLIKPKRRSRKQHQKGSFLSDSFFKEPF